MLNPNSFILSVPDFSGGLVFTHQVLLFLLLMLALLFAILFCIKGYKHFSAMCVMVISLGGALGAAVLTEHIANAQLAMAVFTGLTFILSAGVYVLVYSLRARINRTVDRRKQAKGIAVFSALLGGGLLAGLVYLAVYRDAVVCLILFAVAALLSGIHGVHQAKIMPLFYTYEDLCRREPQAAVPEERRHA